MLIYVDIDETICYSPKSRNYANAQPDKKRIQKINKLYDEGHIIVYWTARGTMTGTNWYEITRDQLEEWGAKHHELRMGKPAYDLFIDDKNINSNTYFEDDNTI
jgi:hypothetical protein